MIHSASFYWSRQVAKPARFKRSEKLKEFMATVNLQPSLSSGQSWEAVEFKKSVDAQGAHHPTLSLEDEGRSGGLCDAFPV